MESILNYEALIKEIANEDFKKRRDAIESISLLSDPILYEKIASFLGDDNAITRNSAIEILTNWGKNVTDFIIEKTKSTNHHERIFACNILGDIKDFKATDFILPLLTDEESNVRFAAAEAIGKIGNKEATMPILQYLYSRKDDPWEQFPLILTLGQLEDERSLLPLLSLAENEMLKQPVLQAISNIADERAIPYAIDILKDYDDYVQNLAILTIKNIKDKSENYKINQKNIINLIREKIATISNDDLENIVSNLNKSLYQEDYSIKIGAIFILGLIATNSAVDAIIAFYSSDFEIEINEAFFYIAEKNTSYLLKTLDKKNNACIESIIMVLGENKINEAYDSIINFLPNNSSSIKIQAIKALGKIANSSCIDILTTELITCSSDDVKKAIVTTLSSFSYDLVFPKIEKILNDEISDIYYLIEILVSLEKKIDFSVIKKYLENTDFRIRKTLANALINYYDNKETIPTLVKLLNDVHPQVRETAINSLSLVGTDKNIISSLIYSLEDQEPWVRYSAVKALAKLPVNDEVISNLIKLINDKIPFVKIAVIDAFGELKASETMDILFKFILDKDPDIAETAILAISNLDLSEKNKNLFLDLLAIQIESKEWLIRKAVAKALGNIKNEESFELLFRMLASETETIVDNEILTSIAKYNNKEAICALIDFINFEELRDKSMDLLSKYDEVVIPYLKDSFDTNDFEAKLVIISILGEIKSNKVIPLLLKYSSEDLSPNIRKQALLALSNFSKDQRAIWAIMWAANNDSDQIVKQTAKMLMVS